MVWSQTPLWLPRLTSATPEKEDVTFHRCAHMCPDRPGPRTREWSCSQCRSTYISFPGNALRVKVLDGPMLLENEVSCAHGRPSYQGHGPLLQLAPDTERTLHTALSCTCLVLKGFLSAFKIKWYLRMWMWSRLSLHTWPQNRRDKNQFLKTVIILKLHWSWLFKNVLIRENC